MSAIISFHAWEGVDWYVGDAVWTCTLGWASFTLTYPRIELIIEQMRGARDQ